MTIHRYHDFEGWPAAAAITTAGAGSGDKWDDVKLGTSASILSTTQSARGARAAAVQTGSSQSTYLEWVGLSGLFPAAGMAYVSCKFLRNSFPGVSYYPMYGIGQLGQSWRMGMGSAGLLNLRDLNDSVLWTAPDPVLVSTFFRVELAEKIDTVTGAGNGQLQLKVWLDSESDDDPDMTSPVFTCPLAGFFYGVRFGSTSNNNTGFTIVDDPIVADAPIGNPYAGTIQILAPVSTVLSTGWSVVGAASPHLALDETVASDTDYVSSPNNPNDSPIELALTPAQQAGLAFGGHLDFRMKSTDAATSTMVVELRQGSTVIASASYSPVPAAYTTYTLELTPVQQASITNAADLRMRFRATATGS